MATYPTKGEQQKKKPNDGSSFIVTLFGIEHHFVGFHKINQYRNQCCGYGLMFNRIRIRGSGREISDPDPTKICLIKKMYGISISLTLLTLNGTLN